MRRKDIFYDDRYCEDGKTSCYMLERITIHECTQFNEGLEHYGMYMKCSECIKQSKKLYPELYV